MISLKKYLDSKGGSMDCGSADEPDLPEAAIGEYGALLEEMGSCCVEACPATGGPLKLKIEGARPALSPEMGREALQALGCGIREQMNGWGRATAKHYQEKAAEVKDLLLSMVRTAEGVSARDERCAGRMNEVTDRLRAIASLENLTEIRASIEKSASDLKASIERMTVEGKAALDALRKQVTEYQTKLDEAEAIAARDALTGLSSRHYVEGQVEKRIQEGAVFCVVLIDIDGFKHVNDQHGHLTGDDLLKQFATELRSACHATDVVGRWGGDEFLLLFDCGLKEAEARTERLRRWICGGYTIRGRESELKLEVEASFGLTQHATGETLKELIARADAAMYAEKGKARDKRAGAVESFA